MFSDLQPSRQRRFARRAAGGGGGGSPTATAPPPVVVTRSFPAGDAVAAGGGTAWDIIGVKTTLTGQFASGGGNLYDTLRVDVTFAQNIANALPLPGQPLTGLNELGISIGLRHGWEPGDGRVQNMYGRQTVTPKTRLSITTDQGKRPQSVCLDGNYTHRRSRRLSNLHADLRNPAAESQTTVASGAVHIGDRIFLDVAIGVGDGSPRFPRIGVEVAAL